MCDLRFVIILVHGLYQGIRSSVESINGCHTLHRRSLGILQLAPQLGRLRIQFRHPFLNFLLGFGVELFTEKGIPWIAEHHLHASLSPKPGRDINLGVQHRPERGGLPEHEVIFKIQLWVHRVLKHGHSSEAVFVIIPTLTNPSLGKFVIELVLDGLLRYTRTRRGLLRMNAFARLNNRLVPLVFGLRILFLRGRLHVGKSSRKSSHDHQTLRAELGLVEPTLMPLGVCFHII